MASSLCRYCGKLSFRTLVSDVLQASKILDDYTPVPFYSHHRCFGELEESYRNGCSFCGLIVRSLKTNRILLLLDQTYPVQDGPIKICLHSSCNLWVYTRGKVGRNNPLDELLIWHDSTDQVWGSPQSILTLGVPPHLLAPYRIDGYQIGRSQTDPDLGSKANFNLANRWLRECQATHESCRRRIVPCLPTKVIDVRERRLVYSRGCIAEYTALSHCWGGNIPNVLTTATLQSWEQSLPGEELPANLRDPITITGHLGIRYLWIDCLCIIQDSPDDWANEADKMASVYGCSTLTICAAASAKSTTGILVQNLQLSSESFVDMTFASESVGASGFIRAELQRDQETLRLLEAYGPWNSRCWTLQEKFLSRSWLIYGRHRIHWHWAAGYRAADIDHLEELEQGNLKAPPPISAPLSYLLHSGVIKNSSFKVEEFLKNDNTISQMQQDFYSLVEDYSRRDLTLTSDLLDQKVYPKFAGHIFGEVNIGSTITVDGVVKTVQPLGRSIQNEDRDRGAGHLKFDGRVVVIPGNVFLDATIYDVAENDAGDGTKWCWNPGWGGVDSKDQAPIPADDDLLLLVVDVRDGIIALAIRQVVGQKDDVFERIGIANFYSSDQKKHEAALRSCEKRTITLI
ncbi:heterokaryon incompatibility protein-domain-containing protein [Podospora fimiseda]|uniref:Heterokaryon incompatibility protein-domain-containing protein n=1 Tax=Podospora fimiseda TaxID=252190 RepID=A0AAN7GX50_9PEZI|nr:heterokaryon incompatibility protein-domain-containing protein [Podospora fimiseda]